MKRFAGTLLILIGLTGSAFAVEGNSRIDFYGPGGTDVPVADGGTGASTLSGLLKGNGTDPITTAVAGTDYQLPLATTWNRVAHVDANYGNDGTGALGRPDKPYATIAAAQTAALTAGGNWVIHIYPGDYTDTGLLPGDADALLAYYYEPLTTHTVTGSGNLFDWTGDYTGKRLVIAGNCRFLAQTSATGYMIDSNYLTTKMKLFHVECLEINNGNGRSVGPFRIQGDTDSQAQDGWNWIRCHGDLNSRLQHAYFRIDSDFTFIYANMVDGVDTEGTGPIMIKCGYCSHLRISPTAFTPGSMVIESDYRVKSTDAPSITLRYGNVVVKPTKGEVTATSDSTQSFLLIPSNAVTTNPGDCDFTIYGGYGRIWNGNSTPPFINFAKVSSNIRGRLINVGPVCMEDPSATESISAVGAQDLDIIGTYTSNLPISSNITVKGGGTVIIDSALRTGF